MNIEPKIHLAKALKERGNYTKSEIKELINQNRVLVNNKIEALSYIVKDNDIITVDNIVLDKVSKVYYLYHKPVGVVCTNKKDIENSIVNKLKFNQRVFCVGRLDKETSGLLILTNDGLFSNSLMNPNSLIEKEYIVKVKYPITEEFIHNMEKPIILRGKQTLPASVKKIDDFTFKIIITEGKYHQIRRLVIYNKNTVVALKRIRIDKYNLSDLKENGIREFKIGDN